MLEKNGMIIEITIAWCMKEVIGMENDVVNISHLMININSSKLINFRLKIVVIFIKSLICKQFIPYHLSVQRHGFF